jgi:thioesterase domain-containing protein
MAELYVKEMRDFQPQGPYMLFGSCMGGLIAFEMARQLIGQGQQLSLLAILDTRMVLETRLRFESLLEDALDPDIPDELLNPNRARRKLPILVRLGKRLRRTWRTLRKLLDRDQRRRFLVGLLNTRAAQSHRPRPYPGKVHLLWSSYLSRASRRSAENNLKAWHRLVPNGLEVHPLPGLHEEIWKDPSMSVIISTLRECLDRSIRAIRFGS